MDKQFWLEIMNNEYEIPDEYSIEELTLELFSYIGNTDPDLRDDIGYIVYANWLEMGQYSQAEISEHIQILLENLDFGIGEKESDSVFLRSFSVLFLAEIVHNDNKAPQLNKEQIQEVLEKCLAYLQAEKDPRGYIQDKGWAHAPAHTSDLLRELARNEHTGLLEHKQILNIISEKLVAESGWIYVHGEDDRISAVVLSILQRDLLPIGAINDWLKSFIAQSWKGAWRDEERTRAYFNVRNFLRSLFLQVVTEDELPKQAEIENSILETIQNLRPY